MRALAIIRCLYVVAITALPVVRLSRVQIVAEGIDRGLIGVAGHQNAQRSQIERVAHPSGTLGGPHYSGFRNRV